jgi:hypothetical protein
MWIIKKNRLYFFLSSYPGPRRQARAKALTPEELSAIGTKAGKARAKALRPEERSAIAKKAVEARIPREAAITNVC